jgi:hypothetical protein
MTAIEPGHGFAAAAQKLQDAGYAITERWLRDHVKAVPHTKVGREIRFTDSHLAELLEQHTHRPVAKTDEDRPVGRRRSA